jgi:hypothetical protein
MIELKHRPIGVLGLNGPLPVMVRNASFMRLHRDTDAEANFDNIYRFLKTGVKPRS